MDISKLVKPAKTVVTEALGPLIVRGVSIGALTRAIKLADLENSTDTDLARALLLDVCSVPIDGEQSQENLRAEQFDKLTHADKWTIYQALFDKRDAAVSPEASPDAAIAEAVKAEARGIVETGRSIRAATQQKFDSALGILSGKTTQMLDQVAKQSSLLNSVLQQPDWLSKLADHTRRAEEQRVSPIGFDSSDFGAARIELPRVPDLDLSESPVVRTANAVEQNTEKLDQIAQVVRLTLENNNQMHGVVAQAAVELSLQAKKNDTQSKRNFIVAIVAIAASIIASIAQILQAGLYNKENNDEQSKSQMIAKQQLDSVNALLRQSEQNGAAMRELAAARRGENDAPNKRQQEAMSKTGTHESVSSEKSPSRSK